MVPEIGLTPQLEQRARAVLGDQVVVVHSRMAAGARARAWWRLRSGNARVVVGPRSAVFSPIENVGLIVVDEEQDSAYKQAERPRYQGREVALWRAQLEHATIVLGSATPAVESFAAGQRGDVVQQASSHCRRLRRTVASAESVDRWADQEVEDNRCRHGVARQAKGRLSIYQGHDRGLAGLE